MFRVCEWNIPLSSCGKDEFSDKSYSRRGGIVDP